MPDPDVIVFGVHVWLVGLSLVLVVALVLSKLQQVSDGRVGFDLILQILISLVLLGAGLYVILSKQYGAADTNWAYGMVGTVVGYWLKGK